MTDLQIVLAKLESLNKDVQSLTSEVNSLRKQLQSGENEKTPFHVFCREHDISRPTGYAWADRGLIKLEKIGGRQYVTSSSLPAKYQRSIN